MSTVAFGLKQTARAVQSLYLQSPPVVAIRLENNMRVFEKGNRERECHAVGQLLHSLYLPRGTENKSKIIIIVILVIQTYA